MRITSVEIYDLHTEVMPTWHPVIVRVNTDEGISGLGEVGLVGGITEGKKICDYANTYDITVQMHVCGSPVATAAALQLEAVIPNFIIHEHHSRALKDFNIEMCVQDYQPENGTFEIPDLSGLGIELNDRVVSRSPCAKVS